MYFLGTQMEASSALCKSKMTLSFHQLVLFCFVLFLVAFIFKFLIS